MPSHRMSNADKQAITFAVPGQSGALTSAARGAGAAAVAQPLPGQLKASVRVGAQRGVAGGVGVDDGALVRVTAVPDEDYVALHIEGGPVLMLHPATARDLLRGAAAPASRGADDDGDVVVVPQLQWPGVDAATATRGITDIGRVVISGFQVLKGLFSGPAADFAASVVVQKVDGQVDAGVYALRADRLDKLKDSGSKLGAVPASGEPMLVLLHGTFVDTTSTFAALWKDHHDGVERLFTQYGGRVYALDHPTLGVSPIGNARTLVDALPADARLHLVTHSRGGLVAEVLARLAGVQGALTAADFAFFSAPEYAAQKQELTQLAEQVRNKRIHVERVVRVACPARGTLLASGRLDAYVSVLKWTLEGAGLPVLPAFVDFIGEVARRRADPVELPGLAAMIPGTPLVNWLNAAPHDVPGDLRVVAGDLQRGSTVSSWLKSLLADAYYWTDNDIVVQTRSMYGGSPRRGGASFLLDQGSGVTHFTYFQNDKTARAVVNALVEVSPPADFQTIGPLSWAGEDAGGVRGIRTGADRSLLSEAVASLPDASKPAVFVLPGILGSNLRQGLSPDDQRIWLSPRLLGQFSRLAYRPGADHVAEDGPIGMVYADLVRHLDATHEVIPFGYDWRAPLKDEATRLAKRVKAALDARAASHQPVRILAHSMGGLLARTLQLVDPATWTRLMAHSDARLVMLGTPNGGSWAPMQVLSGDDGISRALALVGSPFANHEARQLMAQMPGLLQLQAGLLNDKLGLAKEATWQALADADWQREQQKNWWHGYNGEALDASYRWGVPPQAVLQQACDLRKELDAQATGALQQDIAKVLLVVGHAKTTPVGFEVGSDGFEYLEAQDTGDGRVPLESALLPGVKTWTLDREHGDLPSAKSAFDAFVDLLQRGNTQRLAPLSIDATRGASTASALPLLRSRPSHRPASGTPTASLDQLFGPARNEADRPGARTLPKLRVAVLNGNLSHVRLPLMVGHYIALDLTGTEAVVDRSLAGELTLALQAGLYPEQPGTQRIFINTRNDENNPWQAANPPAAIVVGLGEEGVLTATQLEATVCQGVKGWSQRSHETSRGSRQGLAIAATLLGSGGLGITPGAAARAIAQGVRQANRRLLGTGWPLVTELTLVEWYLDRAGDAWRGLQVLAVAEPQSFDIAATISSGSQPLRRQPDSGYRGADYDLISATTDSEGTISFALDTRRARTEVRAQRTQPTLMRLLVERAATAASSDPKLGRTLFQLLVPLELKPFLAGNDRLALQLDDRTAPIPWELLDSSAGDDESTTDSSVDELPWSIRTRLLRKLNTSVFRNGPRDARVDAAVLVIGDPRIDDPRYPDLPGARDEALAVMEQLGGPGGIAPEHIVALVDSPEFDTVIMALMDRPYRIVHVAGHGAPVQRDALGRVTSRGGVVLSQNLFLGPDEIEKLPVVPELVFVNCCHLGGHDAAQTLNVDQPVAFAAGVADSLINIGVRCVVAAGWAVDDTAAAVFAQTFYRLLLAGAPFVDAVTEARKATRAAAPDSKTWAAYQCYGDPNWVFRPGHSNTATAASEETVEHIASAPGLALALENLAVRARLSRNGGQAQHRLRGLESRYGEPWGGMGAIAEAFAVAWEAADDAATALTWYRRALQANDGSASLQAAESFGSLLARLAWTQGRRAAQGTPELDAARAGLWQALDSLRALVALQPTIQRLSLCGWAWKRVAQLEGRSGNIQRRDEALIAAHTACVDAAEMAAPFQPELLFDPGINRIAIERVTSAKLQRPRADAAFMAALLHGVQQRHQSSPDFCSHATLIELDLYQAIADSQLEKRAADLSARYAEVHAQVATRLNWASVADQADFVIEAPAWAAAAGNKKSLRRAAPRAAARLQAQLEGYAA